MVFGLSVLIANVKIMIFSHSFTAFSLGILALSLIVYLFTLVVTNNLIYSVLFCTVF